MTRGIHRLRLAAIVALVAGVFIGSFSATAAFAADSGYSGSFTVNGVGYQNRAVGNAGGGTVSFSTWNRTSSGTSQSGWSGSRARLIYASSGNICSQTGMLYSNTSRPAGTDWVQSGSGNCGSNTYYSWGVTDHWNGGGYNTFYTPKSPNVNF